MNWKLFESVEDREDACNKILTEVANRRAMGARKYGENDFFNCDNLDSLEEELLDVVNYALFEIIKLRQIKAAMLKITGKHGIEIPMKKQVAKDSSIKQPSEEDRKKIAIYEHEKKAKKIEKHGNKNPSGYPI